MTREEAINRFEVLLENCFDIDDQVVKRDNGIELLQEIFDDFESRICKNCKFYKTYYCESNSTLFEYCSNSQNVQIHDDPATYQETEYGMQVNENFGCNRFERK